MRLYNTLTREVEEFVPAHPGRVGIYVCGATVQGAPHLGHGRYAVAFDVIRRYLRWRGYDVTFVTNITDIEDKIIAAARERGVSTDDVVGEALRQFEDAFAELGIEEADATPRATDHIPDMVEVIEGLIEKGHAYEAGGDVYFAVRSFPGYGKLSGRNVDDLLAGARVEPGAGKGDPLDFALWKASKTGEPSWASPWGPGRPGWHIECSVMATKYLGFGFDIHGGGDDLVFPHHENEIAQSEAAAGDSPFARYWLHNGMVNLSGEKMAKSTGHIVNLLGSLERFSGPAVRLYYLRKRYREPFDFSEAGLLDAQSQLERLWSLRRRSPGPVAAAPDPGTLDQFRDAMDDDFNTAEALAVVFNTIREGHRRLDAGEDAGGLVAAYDVMADVLGLAEPPADVAELGAALDEVAARHGVAASGADDTIAALVERRTAARAERDWETADRIRDDLAALGIELEDGAGGTRWHRLG